MGILVNWLLVLLLHDIALLLLEIIFPGGHCSSLVIFGKNVTMVDNNHAVALSYIVYHE
jgi:hypothetical protein